jgi:hypothetical protein
VGSASGVNVAPEEVESLLSEVRERVRADGNPVWWIGPLARPTDVHECLEALGLGMPRAARELQWHAFDTPEECRALNRPRLRADFEESQRGGIPAGFLATIDGRPAGTALAIPSDRGVFLIGGSTAEWARGRGLPRARARAVAVRRPTRHARARHPRNAEDVVSDPAAPRLRRGLQDPAPRRLGIALDERNQRPERVV